MISSDEILLLATGLSLQLHSDACFIFHSTPELGLSSLPSSSVLDADPDVATAVEHK